MYAVIQAGGKQYRVEKGDRISVERISGEVGESVDLDVLLVGGDDQTLSGAGLEGARVVGKIVDHPKADKVIVSRYKRRKMYRRFNGHRQLQTGLEIESIELAGSQKKSRKKAAPADSAGSESESKE